ncbi:uncharacterized protein [Drosophila pseudoobscura]|uniref:Uncharacterized protein isoform X1 n=1 Tax=Drosophila pseudoobscura pseudoobscura TaxID=46245 RepID=A0A6I8V6I9_DROPS|nr:uncharacterized protein LOC4804872 isoform X1 [Drosophila pseudoobscura]
MVVYVSVFLGWFLIVVIVAVLVRVCCLCARNKGRSTQQQGRTRYRGPGPGPGLGTGVGAGAGPTRVLQSYRIDPPGANADTDRQGGALNTSEDRPHNRYGDIFFIEPSSEESARIRSQLEKDDKELPSYDEVMRMCNLTMPTAAAAAPHSPLAVPSPIGIAALPAPPYSESDPYAGAAEAGAGAGSAISPTVITMEPEPSTSRAAQTPTTTNVGRSAPLTLPNTASNTEV